MRPLEGIRVVDFTQAHAGSLATMILADFGAEVIKIERPNVGDLARYWEPKTDKGSGYYAYLNRGKKSVAVNAGSQEGRDIIKKLVAQADVVCENFKFGSMERLGLSYEELIKVNPQLIYASLCGFGQTGPLKNTIALDLQMQAMSGLMDRTGFPDGAPTKVGAAMGDQLSGTYLAIAINLALIHRSNTGQGQKIDIAILDSIFSILEAAPVTYNLRGRVPERVGNAYPSIAPYDTFATKDGFVSIGISTNSQWKRFCSAMGLSHLTDDPRYIDNEKRGDNYENGLKAAIEEATGKMSKFEVEDILRAEGLACGAVYTVSEAMETEQIRQREMLIDMEDSDLGKVTMPGISIKLSNTPGEAKTSAPRIGEHTVKYLKSLQYGEEEIKTLMENEVVASAN